MLNALSTNEATNTVPALSKAETEERRRMKEWLDRRIEAGRKHPIAEIVTLTPVLATLILEHNPVNRPLSRRNTTELQQDVANKRFAFNGESIIISNTGVLNDGQHRCQSVIATNISIQTVIVFGPKEETRFTVDTGKSKTLSNFLTMKGRKYTHALGPAVAYHLEWKEKGVISRSGYDRPTKQAVMAAAEELKGFDSSVDFTSPTMKTIRGHAVLAFCHYVFWKRSGREEADYFIGRLIDGDDLKRGNPIHFCRNRLLGMGRGVHAGERVELIFKCWNAHRTGGQIALYRTTGKLPKLER